MKKIICMAAVLFAAFAMISCGSPEDKAREFCERGFELGQKGDMEGIKKLIEEESEYVEKLSPSEQIEYRKAVEKWTQEKMSDVADAFGDALDDLDD